MASTIGVVVFPGSNCEHDVVRALSLLGVKGRLIWHSETDIGLVDGVVIPGGFAHGDYLRPGAIARFSPIMNSIVSTARRGIPVLGICNGFQVLTEAGLLPGALQKNSGLRFICRDVELEVVSNRSVASSSLAVGRKITLPINHFEGNFTCDEATLSDLNDNDQVVFRYVDNPNGSVESIAAISNVSGNVVGMMPHPERASEAILGGTDGLSVFESLLSSVSISG